jgi:hypothetical protein
MDPTATDSGGSTTVQDVFSGGLKDLFDAATQIKLAQAYGALLPAQGYAVGPTGQLVTQNNQQPVTKTGAAAGPGGVSWVVIIGGLLLAGVVVVVLMRR